jgi:hypothetical protein
MSDRSAWARAFFEAGYSRTSMNQLNDDEFSRACQFLIDAGLASPLLPLGSMICTVPSTDQKMSDLSLIAEQNCEFERVLNEAISREREIEGRKRSEDEIRIRTQAEEAEFVTNAHARIRARASQIPIEPTNGVIISVCLPNAKRVTRKFGANDSGENIFAFVANNDEMFDEKSLPLNFGLICGGSQMVRLDRCRTLSEQGIERRVLLHVIVDDDCE